MNITQKIRKLKRKLFGNPKLKSKRYPTYWFNQVLGEKAIQIVQIGSNDGRVGDPLYHLFHQNKNWKGLFVEPVPYIFERLKNNYSNDPRFRFENAAINGGEMMEFHWVDPIVKEHEPDLPFFYDQLGSFDKSHIINALDGKLAPYIISQKINGLTLEGLLAKHQIKQFDLLHIDVEGYDWEVLQQLNLAKNKPIFILYEGVHLSEKARMASADFLKRDYELFKHEGDILAVNRRVEARILEQISKNIEAFDPKNYEVK